MRFATYLLIFFSGFVLSDVTYTVNSNESGDAHIITVKRDSDTAEGLDVIWIKKAELLWFINLDVLPVVSEFRAFVITF